MSKSKWETGLWIGNLRETLLIFFGYTILGLALVEGAFYLQLHIYLHRFETDYAIVPTILGITIGLLLGAIALLRHRLKYQNRLFRAVADKGLEFTYFRSIDGEYRYISQSCASLTGYDVEQFYNLPNFMDTIIHPADRQKWEHHRYRIEHRECDHDALDLRIIAKDGTVVWLTHLCSFVHGPNGKPEGIRSSNVDITERKEMEERYHNLANFDPLTNLPNRRYLTSHLNEMIQRFRKEEHSFTLLFLDLDRFKHINDTFGHTLGDVVLREASTRLTHFCQHEMIVSRFGGDEFVVVAPRMDRPDRAMEFAINMLATLEKPFVVDDKHLYLSGSIGITMFPYDGDDAETLIRNADVAMYQSKKNQNTENIHFFSTGLLNRSADFLTMESMLRRAIENDELAIHYQPQVDLRTGHIEGCEALLRWNSPEQGPISPSTFLPVAEETGLIQRLGWFVMEKACRQVHDWQDTGLRLRIAVNVSVRQFYDPDFLNGLRRIIQESCCDPSLFEVEITEYAIMDDMSRAIARLNELRDLGITVALDDFGTGYSSLAYLKSLPIDCLKIDATFVRTIAKGTVDRAIIQAILELSRELGLRVVAEGIEEKEQLEILMAMNCDIGQGFYFGKAMPPEQLEKLLQVWDPVMPVARRRKRHASRR